MDSGMKSVAINKDAGDRVEKNNGRVFQEGMRLY